MKRQENAQLSGCAPHIPSTIMIIDNSKLHPQAQETPASMLDSPPSYDVATAAASSSVARPTPPQHPSKRPLQQPPVSESASIPKPEVAVISSLSSASYVPVSPALPAPTIYHYQDPRTGDVVSSLLPPNHPEMVCLQEGRHLRATKYGVLGVLAAIFWFPLGIGLCMLDRRVHCSRCGSHISEGVFGC